MFPSGYWHYQRYAVKEVIALMTEVRDAWTEMMFFESVDWALITAQSRMMFERAEIFREANERVPGPPGLLAAVIGITSDMPSTCGYRQLMARVGEWLLPT